MPLETDGKNPKQGWILALCIALVVLCAAAAAAVIWMGSRSPLPPDTTGPSTQNTTQIPTVPTTLPTTAPTTVPTEPPVEKIASATIASMGDILMHGPVRDTYITQYIPGTAVGANFNYAPVFANIQEIISQADYAVINL